MDPLREYKREGFALFEGLMERLKEEALNHIFRIQLAVETPQERPKKKKPMQLSHGDDGERPATVRRKGKKIGRNAPCPCGSGKKYKRCCGASA